MRRSGRDRQAAYVAKYVVSKYARQRTTAPPIERQDHQHNAPRAGLVIGGYYDPLPPTARANHSPYLVQAYRLENRDCIDSTDFYTIHVTVRPATPRGSSAVILQYCIVEPVFGGLWARNVSIGRRAVVAATRARDSCVRISDPTHNRRCMHA